VAKRSVVTNLGPAFGHKCNLLQVAQPHKSDSDEVPSKKAKTVIAENDTPQQSTAGATEPEPAASAAPFSGGFGDLASKGASGFAFGGTSTFGSGGFGSVAFGGAFGSIAAGPNSFASKASKDGGDRGSPSVASNAGSAAAFIPNVFAATSDAATTAERTVQVFGGGGSAPGVQPCQLLWHAGNVSMLPMSIDNRILCGMCLVLHRLFGRRNGSFSVAFATGCTPELYGEISSISRCTSSCTGMPHGPCCIDIGCKQGGLDGCAGWHDFQLT
jgi:hypothetical protein